MTAVTAAVLAVSFAIVLVLVSRDEERDLDRSLFLQAQASADRALLRDADNPRISEGEAHIPERISSITRYVVVYAANGKPTSFSYSFLGRAPSFAALGLGTEIDVEGESVNLVVRGVPLRGVVIPIGSSSQSMLYAVSRRTIDEDLQFLRRLVSVIFLTALLVTSLLARWISRRISRDVEAIASVARAVTGGNLRARVGDSAHGTTETLTLGADVDRMVHQLGVLVDTQRTFVSHAAHELRSPLSTIRGELQLALRRERTADEYREAIEETLTDVQSLTSLAEDLLLLARVQDGTAGQRGSESVSVEEILSETLHTVRGTARVHDVRLTVEPTADSRDWVVLGSRSELVRALRNLVDNAIVHSPLGGEVKLCLETTDDRLRIVVVDQGPGIPEHDRPNIFEPFFRGSKDQGGDRPGAGLGLPIARDIARAHGGELRLEGEGPGCRFVLELPCVSARRA